MVLSEICPNSRLVDSMKILAPGVIVIGKYLPQIMDAEKIGMDLVEMTKHIESHGQGRGNYIGPPAASDATEYLAYIVQWMHGPMHAEVRSPESSAHTTNPVTNWHHDGIYKPRPDGDYGTSLHDEQAGMVVWSNRESTEIRLADETVIRPEPGDIVLIRNMAAMHRTPLVRSADRWFFRRYVKVNWEEYGTF